MKNLARFARIAFIEPKSTHLHVYSACKIPRLGSLLLSTILRDRGHQVSVIVEDLLPDGTTDSQIWEQIRGADLLCVSSITMTIEKCYYWCDRARAAGMPVLLGGTHPTYFPDEAIPHADWLLRGECDTTLPVLMDTLDGNGDLSGIPGLSWRSGKEIVHNPLGRLPSSADLERNPFPDYELLWHAKIRDSILSVAVARGCPFDCSFCSVTKFNGAGMRCVSAERTLDMIEDHWHRYRPHYVFFAEDIFNLNKVRAKAIMRGLIDRNIRPRIGFGAQVRHEVVKDKEFLELMQAAKFERAMVGFESVNQASLDLCGKRQQVQQIEDAIAEFHRHKIKVHGMFVGGFDTDTPQTFGDTLKFVKKHDLDSFQFMLLTPLPGTRDWHSLGYADGSRPLLTRKWAFFDGHHQVTVPKKMTAYEANTQVLRAMRKFYSLPRAAVRLIRGDWVEFLLRMQGRSIVRQWFRTPENIDYLSSLKEQLSRPELSRSVGALHRRIIVAHTATSIAFKENFESFFAELGVKVEHSRAGLGELLGQGQLKVGELRSRVGEFLSDYDVFSRRSTDLVVVAADCGNSVNLESVELGTDAPLLVRLNINQQAGVLAQQCVQLAGRFTTDLRAAAEAFRRAMPLIEAPTS